jgi:hypothetical protein
MIRGTAQCAEIVAEAPCDTSIPWMSVTNPEMREHGCVFTYRAEAGLPWTISSLAVALCIGPFISPRRW